MPFTARAEEQAYVFESDRAARERETLKVKERGRQKTGEGDDETFCCKREMEAEGQG